ncbi:MAG: hypothetical protein IKU46_04450 [Peptococcaceae bacterium]|nr:hypothetical protein [Peptococcaceae bacterium]
MKEVIMAISVDKRSTSAAALQETLTKYGELIHFRLGMHNLHSEEKKENGRILLQVIGADEKIQALQNDLAALDLVKVQSMELE